MGVHFAEPNWAHGLWGVLVVVALLWWLDSRRRAAIEQFMSRVMLGRLMRGVSPARRRASLILWGLSCSCLIVALMRPQGPPTFAAVQRTGAQIMVCLDVSKSMLAEDTAPNRLERAKAELTDLLAYLQGDQVGLIAFAGRATLLCPLTTDFGFFKLVLDGASPGSVGRGGTRLEEPIRRAVEGFRTEVTASQVILLLTDGEDLDSYPLKAAEEAAQRGIRILAVGFGDEAGSEVRVTDPRTGVKSVVKDADGKPVRSRLDGETLRQMALATDGVYIPAGTGALDLESIYRAHIARLTRSTLDSRDFSVRPDWYPWALLAGLFFLFCSLAMVAGSGAVDDRNRSTASRVTRAAVLACVLAACNRSAVGQGADADQKTKSPPPPNAALLGGKESASRKDPRQLYNEALAALTSQPDRAEQLLTESRRNSGTDAEVRYRATYNLGWIEVHRADAKLKAEPQQALDHLRAAANWFSDAVRLRSDSGDARHNLEVVLRRAEQLADSLRKKDPRDLNSRIDAAMEAQRGLLNSAAGFVEELVRNADPNAAARYRSEFRGLSVQQRTVLSDVQGISKAAREELDALAAKKSESQQPQEALRAAQLKIALDHLGQSEQRMNQTRSQLRQQQGERAFRRGSAALDELKRARDQFREPPELLDVLIADMTQLASLTDGLGASRRIKPTEMPTPPPTWLTREFLEDSQQSVAERTRELADRMAAMLSSSPSRPAGPLPPDKQLDETRTEQMVRTVRDASPFLSKAAEACENARSELAADRLDAAFAKQTAAVIALREAQERFLDLRGLIERIYADELASRGIMESPPADKETQAQLADVIEQVQKKNLDRCARLDQLLDDGLAAARAKPATPSTPGQPESEDAEMQRLTAAKQLLAGTRSELDAALKSLSKPADAKPADAKPADAKPADAKPAETAAKPEIVPKTESTAKPAATVAEDASQQPLFSDETRAHVGRSVELLEDLRRLFFSIVEHLRETAERQTQLNDETIKTSALTGVSEAKQAAGPLANRQQGLQATTAAIADALKKQAAPSAAKQPGKPSDQEQMLEKAAQTLNQASELVTAGSEAMKKSAAELQKSEVGWKEARDSQKTALAKLNEALALLTPPQEQPPPEQQPDSGEKKDQQKDQNDQQQDQKQQSAGSDMAKLLQAVREREAQRKKDKSRQTGEQEPVDKDW
jgi:Ca-activated chloride channel family protein